MPERLRDRCLNTRATTVEYVADQGEGQQARDAIQTGVTQLVLSTIMGRA